MGQKSNNMFKKWGFFLNIIWISDPMWDSQKTQKTLFYSPHVPHVDYAEVKVAGCQIDLEDFSDSQDFCNQKVV